MQIHAYIKGKVTGVFFRKFAKQEADRVGVTGWIRNVYDKPDIFGPNPGVEVRIQGTKDQIDEIILWLHKGPPMAKVSEVSIVTEDESEAFNDFQIQT